MDISQFIINSAAFARLQDYSGEYDGFTYGGFLDWNRRCINDLSADDYIWIAGLCNRIMNRKISLTDETYFSRFATSIYFDQDKRICIMNPR